MKKLFLIIATTLLAWPASAADVNETVDAAPDGHIEIFNTAGSVKVEGWSRGSVEVTGTLGNEVEDFIFERDGDEVLIKVKAKHGRSGHKGFVTHLVIRAPEDSSLEIATISADIEVKSVYGEIEAHAISGDVELEMYAAEVEVESVSGDIDVQGDGKATVAELVSVSGDVTAEKLAGEVVLESVSGDIVLASGSYDDVAMETVNGDIVFQASLQKGGEVNIETVNGTVDADFVGDVSAEFEVETFNGRIRNCFGPKPERVSKYAPGYELSFTEGGGDGNVSIATLNGNLNLCKN
jgi:DUF4097 and DUF4098 domain-containing protein YvlB